MQYCENTNFSGRLYIYLRVFGRQTSGSKSPLYLHICIANNGHANGALRLIYQNRVSFAWKKNSQNKRSILTLYKYKSPAYGHQFRSLPYCITFFGGGGDHSVNDLIKRVYRYFVGQGIIIQTTKKAIRHSCILCDTHFWANAYTFYI